MAVTVTEIRKKAAQLKAELKQKKSQLKKLPENNLYHEEAEKCKASLKYFVQHFWSEVPGTSALKWSWHLDVFCEELEVVARRVFANQPREYDEVLNVSPGTSKSTVWSILFPAWCWANMPECRIMTASHTDALALDLANKTREVIKSELYSSYFPEIEIRKDQDTKGYYANTRGGDRLTCTVAGKSPLGFHASILIVDDPVDPKKAMSEKEIETARHFIAEILPTRKVDKRISVTLLVMQRLGLGDPTDVMLAESRKEGASPVRHVCLPAELQRNSDGSFQESDVIPQELAKRYINGLMDPVRLDEKTLAEAKARGALYYSTQFLQKPYARSGGLFHEEWFNHRVKAAPFDCKWIMYIDRASSESSGCLTAMVLLGKSKDSLFYVADVITGQWGPYERNQRIRAAALKYRARYGPANEPKIYIEKEPGSSDKDAWLGIARALQGFSVFEDNVSKKGDKVKRAEPWSAQLAAGAVRIVDNGQSEGTGQPTWDIERYIEQHLAFPLGEYLDVIDASSGAFNLLVGKDSRRTTPLLRVFPLGTIKKNEQKIYVCTHDDLANLVIEDRALLISLNDPDPVGTPDTPAHGINHLLDKTILQFADISPEHHQENWNDPLQPYGKTCEQLMMSMQHGKQIWSMLVKKRPEPWQIMVITCSDGNRSQTAAGVICDMLRMDRKNTLWNVSSSDNKVVDKPINEHVARVLKATRGMVL